MSTPACAGAPIEITSSFIARNRIEVLHVLHGARDYEAILFPEA